MVHYLCDCDAAGSPLPLCECLWARVRTLSTSGISLLLGTPIPSGTGLAIHLKAEDSGSSIALTARVVGTARRHEGSWTVDCRFHHTLSEEQVLALL